MEIMKALLGLENCRIQFSTGEGDYEGTITRIAPKIQLLVLNQLIWLPKNIKLGTLTFRASEVKSFSVISRTVTPKVDVCSAYDCANLYERDCQRPNIFDDEFDDTSSVNDSVLSCALESEDREYCFDLPPSLSNDLPVDNIVIDDLNHDFHDAIQHFQKQDVIGLTLESPKIGRYENIHWLCISTVSCTFLFDIKTLEESAFNNGLREILEDSRIEKVVHDCREVSNCLFHKYDTRLSNVFDTQVADFIINQQRRKDGKIIHNVNTVNSCLTHYLGIQDEFLLRRIKRSYQDDLVFYGLRPVSDNLRDFFTKNVIYLRRLKQELDILLVEPMNKCTNIYIKSMQSKTDRELQLEKYVHNAVPAELLYEEIQVFRFKKHMSIPTAVFSGPPFRKFRDSFKEYVNYCKKHEVADSELGDGKFIEPYKGNHSSNRNYFIDIDNYV